MDPSTLAIWPPPGGLYPAALQLMIALAIYLVPAATALSRRHPQRRAIAAINLLLGWTVVGWLLALAWSLSGPNGHPNRAAALGGPADGVPAIR